MKLPYKLFFCIVGPRVSQANMTLPAVAWHCNAIPSNVRRDGTRVCQFLHLPPTPTPPLTQSLSNYPSPPLLSHVITDHSLHRLSFLVTSTIPSLSLLLFSLSPLLFLCLSLPSSLLLSVRYLTPYLPTLISHSLSLFLFPFLSPPIP